MVPFSKWYLYKHGGLSMPLFLELLDTPLQIFMYGMPCILKFLIFDSAWMSGIALPPILWGCFVVLSSFHLETRSPSI
jgi:hypothetical protein